MGTVYAVASGKGGVGKTTTTVNLGAVLAGDGHRVAIVDADVGMADLASLVSLQPDAATLEDVLAEEASVGEATYRLADGLFAVPSARDLARYSVAIADHLGPLVDRLRDAFDVVLVDVGAGISQETVTPLRVADVTLLVTTPDPTAVRGAETTATLVDRAGGHVAGTVCTRVRDEDPAAVVESLPGDLLAAVPEDDAVRDSVNAGVPVVAHAPDSPAARAYRDLAERLADLDPDAGDQATPVGPSDDEIARRVAAVEEDDEETEPETADDAVEADGGRDHVDAGDASGQTEDADDEIDIESETEFDFGD